MSMVCGLDLHRQQITFDAVEIQTGEAWRGRVWQPDRERVRRWLRHDVALRANGEPVAMAVEGCTGWRYVVEEISAAGFEAHVAEPADTQAARGPKHRAKTDRSDARLLRDLLQRGELPESWIPPAAVLEWRERVRLYKSSGGAETVFALANGYLGIRGTLDEGRPSLAPGTYISGFHETWPIVHAEEAYGLARVGQSMLDAPDATVLELFVDDEPLFLPTARVREYARVLDMRDGILQRDLVWSTLSGKHVTVRSSRLVSLEHRHVAVISYEVTTDQPASIAVVSRVVNRADEHLERGAATRPSPRTLDSGAGCRTASSNLASPRTPTADDARLRGHEQPDDPGAVGVAARRLSPSPPPRTSSVAPDERGGPHRRDRAGRAGAGHQVRRLPDVAEWRRPNLAARCDRTLDRAVRDGFEALVAAQRRNLDRFWDGADVVVESTFEPVRVQQAVRWNLFQLAQASWRAEGRGIPAKGLTGGAYDGHYFWDTEVYAPPVPRRTPIPGSPGTCCGSVTHAAGRSGAGRGRLDRGAPFPWRTINGEEASTPSSSREPPSTT